MEGNKNKLSTAEELATTDKLAAGTNCKEASVSGVVSKSL